MTAVLQEAPPAPDLRVIIDPNRLTLAQFWELAGKARSQGRISTSAVFWQAVGFFHFHASELDCCLGDMAHLANIYANKFDVCPQRFYEHRSMVRRAGLIRRVQHSAPGQGALWQLVWPIAQLPGDVGPELARALRLDLPDAEITEPEPEYSVGSLTANPPEWDKVEIRHLAWKPGTAPPEPEDLAVEAILPWLDVETLCVARGLRAEQQHAELWNRPFDVVEAEAAVRRRLLFSVIENATGPVDDAPGQTPSVTPNPEVSPCSLERLFPTIDLTLRKYWSSPVDNSPFDQEGGPSARSWKDEVGPGEQRRADRWLRRCWGAWKAWQAACGHRVDLAPIRHGQWRDLVDVAALALRRISPSELVDLLTETLDDTIDDLAKTLHWRMWQQIKTKPEWAGARRVQLDDGRWIDAIGRHSEAAAARLAEFRPPTRYPALPFPAAESVPEHVKAARSGLLRSKTMRPLTGKKFTQSPPRGWEVEIQAAIDAAQAERDAAAAAAVDELAAPVDGFVVARPRTAAESQDLHQVALARKRADQAAAEAERRRAEREAWSWSAPAGPIESAGPAPEWAAPPEPRPAPKAATPGLTSRLAEIIERCEGPDDPAAT